MLTHPTDLPDVLCFEPLVYADARGFFMETYQEQRYAAAGLTTRFIQDNHSGSEAGVLRGLHYQLEEPQGKLVRTVAGVVYDVAVDLRRSSPTFGQWVGMVLSAGNRRQLWIPPGFAHGFLTLSSWAEVLYKVDAPYAPQWERTLRWDDPTLGIDWPLPDDRPPILSDKDARGRPLGEADLFP